MLQWRGYLSGTGRVNKVTVSKTALFYQDSIQGLSPLLSSIVGFQSRCKSLHDVGDDVMSTAGNRVARNPACNSSPILPRHG